MSILQRTDLRRFEGNSWLRWLGGLVLAGLVLCSFAAPASAETRTLKLYFIHTKERAEITYKRNGRYDKAGLEKINRFLRDWRRNEPAKMDPRLLDLVWSVYKSVGARDYIHVVSAYRSPATNAMLRKRSSGVAKQSQHMLGKAMDFYIPGVSLSKLRAAGFKAEGGGVGYYPKSGAPFVHLDVGNVRSWPRMSRGELMALFPDGKTIHVPSDGKPLPGFKQALAAYESRKRNGSSIQIASASSDGNTGRGAGGLLAALFGRGGGADEEEDSASVKVAAAPAPRAEAEPVRQAPQPEPDTPAEIIADLPERSVPLPGVAPRPLVDVGAPSTPLIAGLPEGEVPQPFEEAAELAVDIPLPTSRPDYTPEVQVALAETDEPDLPITAIAPERARGGGSEAITEMLAMTAADARADVVINPPTPDLRPQVPEIAAGTQVASVETPRSRGDVFVLASLPVTRSDAADDRSVPLPNSGVQLPVDSRKVASLAASPRKAVMDRETGMAAAAALESGVHTTPKSAKPSAAEARPDPRSIPIPVKHELTRWAFTRDVTVATAGGTRQPAKAHEAVRSAPSQVYTAGFQQAAVQQNANRFTGKAVSFMSVATFESN